MRTFKIKNGDLVIENGDLVMVEGEEEQMQSIERILTTNKGEWFLNTDFGLDYNRIQGKNKTEEEIKLAMVEALHQDSRVDEVDIVKVEIDRGNRDLKVSFRYTTVNDEVIEGQEVVDIG